MKEEKSTCEKCKGDIFEFNTLMGIMKLCTECEKKQIIKIAKECMYNLGEKRGT